MKAKPKSPSLVIVSFCSDIACGLNEKASYFHLRITLWRVAALSTKKDCHSRSDEDLFSRCPCSLPFAGFKSLPLSV